MEMQRRLHRPFPAGGRVLPYIEPLFEVSGDRLLAQALADNTGKPIVVLDEHLIVVAASISFYLLIGLTRQYVQDCPFFALGDGRWNLAEIRLVLEQVALPQAPVQACEVEQDF